jgi:hypothetical protein
VADGVKFDIDIQAHGLGLDSSAAELNALAERIQTVDTVATKFDTVVAATAKRLEEASAAAKVAAGALGLAEAKYLELERNANRAAKAVEKAAAAGKNTAELKSKADAAAASLRAQASVVDELRGKSLAAADAQSKLAGTLKTLQARQSTAAAEVKKGGKAAESSAIDYAAMGKAGALAAAAIAASAIGAIYGLGRMAIAMRPDAVMRLSIASQRLDMSMRKLFQGLDLSKFLGALDRMGALFDTTNTSGRALKLLIETIMQPIFDAVAKAEPYVSEFFKGMISGALDVVIAVLKLRNAIFKAMSPETRAAIKSLVDRIFTLNNAFALGEALVVTFGVIIGGVLVVALGAAAIAAASLAAALSVIAALVIGVILAIGLLVALVLLPFVLIGAGIAVLVGKWDGFKKYMKDLAKEAYNWGADIVYGMTGGLLGGSQDLGAAMAKTAAMAKDGIKDPLKIHSPSKVMEELGRYTIAGFVGGIEGGEGGVRAASAGISDAAIDGVGVGSGAAGSTSTTHSRSVHIDRIEIHAPSGDAESIAGAVKRALVELMEGASLTIGGGEVPA